MRWDDVKHQGDALARLDRALTGGRLPHAYVFCGPEGVGKGMAALRMAQRLLCTHMVTGVCGTGVPPVATCGTSVPPVSTGETPVPQLKSDACGTCDDCVAVEAGTHLDLHLVHRALNKFHPDATVRSRQATELGVDVVRHFVTNVAGRSPSRGRARVFIFDEAERMNASAQNAMLKTLEEPPGASFFFLLTTSAERLLPTTRSRCQTIEFARLPDAFVREILRCEHGGLSAEATDYIAGLADGRAGAAMRYARAGLHEIGLSLPETFNESAANPPALSKAMQDLVKTLGGAGLVTESQAGSAGAANRAIQSLTLAMVGCVLRDALRLATRLKTAAYSAPSAELIGLSQRLGPGGAGGAIRALAAAEADLERSVNAQLVFDTLAIEISRAQRQAAA